MSARRSIRDATSYRKSWLVAVVLMLGWGAGAFGSNYPWAYTPLLALAALLGAIGIALAPRVQRLEKGVALGLSAVAFAVGIQVLPFPREMSVALSPHLDALAREIDIAYAFLPSTGTPLSIAPQRTLLGLTFLGAFGLLLLGVARMLSRAQARQTAAGVAVLGTIMAMVGLAQSAMWTGKILWFWTPMWAGASFGPFVNRNHFAGWMLMAIPLAMGLFCAIVSRAMRGIEAGWRQRLLWFSTPEASSGVLVAFAILSMALALVLTMSRSGMAGLAIALLIAGAVMVRRQAGGSRKAIVSAYLIFLALTVVSWVGLDVIAARFAQGETLGPDGRWAIWGDTLRIIEDFWLSGTGLNTYGVSTLHYQASLPGAHLREAHNDYLQLAAEGGLLLGIPILATVGLFIRAVRRRFEEDEGSIWWIRAGAVTGLVAIAFQSLVEFSLQMPGNAALFAVLAGIALHDSRSDESRGARAPKIKPPTCDRCGSINVARGRTTTLTKMLGVIIGRQRWVCRRCSWNGWRNWREVPASATAVEAAPGDGSPDPLREALDAIELRSGRRPSRRRGLFRRKSTSSQSRSDKKPRQQ